MTKKFETHLTYEVTLGEPEFVNTAGAWQQNVPISHEDIEASWSECESDIVYAATAAYDAGDLAGLVFWGTDIEGKWVATTDPEMNGLQVHRLYGRVAYKVDFTSWDYEEAMTAEEVAERDRRVKEGQARIIAEIMEEELSGNKEA